MRAPTDTLTLRPAGPEDLDAILARLSVEGLPTDGIPGALDGFLVAEDESGIAGVAGLERYGEDALLRSVVVAPAWRGRGLGAQLVDAALAAAKRGGTRAVYLLTTTAEHYFPRHGFRAIEREDVPAAVRESVEFRGACPASATIMVRPLD